MTKIEKKIWPHYFEEVLNGEKTYELRLADWDCQKGDILILNEWDPDTQKYTGRVVEKKVGFVGRIDPNKPARFWSKEDVETYGLQIISLK